MSKSMGKSQGLTLMIQVLLEEKMTWAAIGIAVVACILMIVTYGLDQAVYREQCKKLFKRSIPDERKEQV